MFGHEFAEIFRLRFGGKKRNNYGHE